VTPAAYINRSPDTNNAVAGRVAAVLGDIKIAHTVFALPFALLTAHLAFMESGGYRIETLIGILICMVTARTAAMSFNRYLDRDIDAENPRTQDRSIPSGRAQPKDALIITIICSVIFIGTCAFLGTLTLILSLPTIAFLLAYSWSKRFTSLTHIWLGAGLAIAPTGAWIAVTGSWSWVPVVLSVAVLLWVAGFDVIYSLQDINFDKKYRVFSIPAKFGERNGLLIARILHFFSFLGFIGFGFAVERGLESVLIGVGWWIAVGLVAILLLAEHSIIKPGDHSRLGIAFFTLNGVISIILYLSVIFYATSIHAL